MKKNSQNDNFIMLLLDTYYEEINPIEVWSYNNCIN